MALSLDGNISYIGTEFIKLLNTGSSDLATVAYVDEQVAQGGGGGGSGDGYTQAEVDALLNNKLNVNNPQDITGNLRLDPTNGNSKIILNATSPPNNNDDFYCNGSAHINGTLRVSLLSSDGDVNCDGVNADVFNSNVITNDIVFNHNDVEYMRFNATNDTIDLSKALNFGSSALKINSLSTNGLNDMVFSVDTLGEFLRFNISDSTVRVPDNRSFLSQNIFTDIIKPVAFANDVVLNGGNSTNDAYEEYMRLDASDEKVNFNKNVDMNEDLIMKSTKVLYLDATSNLLRYITTRNDNGQDILELVNNKATNNQIRFTNNGSTSLIVDNSFVYTPRQIQGNNGLKVDYIDTRSANTDFEFRRSGAVAMTLKENQQVDFLGYVFVNNISTPVNTDLALRRSGTELIRLNSTDQIVLGGELKLPLTNQYITFNNCKIREGVAGVSFFDFINEDTSGHFRFYLGTIDNDNLKFTMQPTQINFYDHTIINDKLEIVDGFGLETNLIDSRGDNDVLFQRDGNEFLRFNGTDDNITCSKEIVAGNSVVVDIAKKLTLKPSLESSINIFDIRNLHPVADNPMIRFRVGVGGGETIVCEMTNANINLSRRLKIGLAYGLDTNVINSNGDNDVVFSRNNVQFMRLDKFTEDVNGTPTEMEAIICSKQLRANGQIRVNNLQINQFSSGVQYADFRLENADSVMRFYAGNGTSANIQMTNAGIELRRETTVGSIKTNTIDTTGDNDLIIRRNGTNVLNIFTYTPTNGPTTIVDAQSDCGISSSWLFANTFANRSANTDTYFRGAISGGLTSGKVYMTYLHATETLDFDCSIDNTGRAVIGNIFDTTASDERLKTNVQDVKSNYCDCVKNVKIKTFEYKDEKYKTNDKYGFIAQELQKHLPKEFDNIVKETKPKKDEGDPYLSINYMKLSLVLWGALQETLNKVEHLEASVYELQEQLKDSKKPKAKAKAKIKS